MFNSQAQTLVLKSSVHRHKYEKFPSTSTDDSQTIPSLTQGDESHGFGTGNIKQHICTWVLQIELHNG